MDPKILELPLPGAHWSQLSNEHDRSW